MPIPRSVHDVNGQRASVSTCMRQGKFRSLYLSTQLLIICLLHLWLCLQSCSNRAEAASIATVVRRLEAAGVPATALGVICFFRAQVPLCLTRRAKL